MKIFHFWVSVSLVVVVDSGLCSPWVVGRGWWALLVGSCWVFGWLWMLVWWLFGCWFDWWMFEAVGLWVAVLGGTEQYWDIRVL